MFPRYGSYPGFHPIVELSMTFHTQVVGANGQRQAMFIERVEGLAEAILSNFELGPPDVMIVFSAGGGTAVPIEIAQGAKARGLTVVAVTSLAQAEVGEGPHLRDHADVVLDLCTPVGDALVELDGLETPVGPGSTIAAVALVNEIKVQTAALLLERGALPPVLTSAAARRPRGVAAAVRRGLCAARAAARQGAAEEVIVRRLLPARGPAAVGSCRSAR